MPVLSRQLELVFVFSVQPLTSVWKSNISVLVVFGVGAFFVVVVVLVSFVLNVVVSVGVVLVCVVIVSF